jgi:hypothetical protein
LQKNIVWSKEKARKKMEHEEEERIKINMK